MGKNKKGIEFVVLEYFIRAMKSEGKYMLFRKGVRNTGFLKYLIKNDCVNSSPFINNSSTLEVINTLEKITNDMSKNNGKKGGIKDLDKYEHVTMTINHLLHFFLEPTGMPMDKLCSIGEKIYNLSCNKLFGDTLEDLEKVQEEESAKAIKDGGQLKAKLFHDYVIGRNNGTIGNITFEQYIKDHSKEFEKFKVNGDDTFNHGIALGAAPDNNEFINEISHRNTRPSWLDDTFDEDDIFNEDVHW